mgnify:CR=1 FL=1
MISRGEEPTSEELAGEARPKNIEELKKFYEEHQRQRDEALGKQDIISKGGAINKEAIVARDKNGIAYIRKIAPKLGKEEAKTKWESFSEEQKDRYAAEGVTLEITEKKGERVISEEEYSKAKDLLDRVKEFTAGEAGFVSISSNIKLIDGLADIIKVPGALIKVGLYHLENGVYKFKEWSEAVIKEYGDVAKDKLREIFELSNFAVAKARIKDNSPNSLNYLANDASIFIKAFGKKASGKIWAADTLKNLGYEAKEYIAKAWELGNRMVKEEAKVEAMAVKYGDPNKMVTKNLSEADIEMLKMVTKDISVEPFTGGRLETSQRFIERADWLNKTKFKETTFFGYNSAENMVKIMHNEWIKKIFPDKETKRYLKRNDINKMVKIYAISKRKGGVELLEKMGVKNIAGIIRRAELDHRIMKAYETVRKFHDEMFPIINAIRVLLGEKPIEKVEDYVTFWEASDKISREGKNILTESLDSINKTLEEVDWRNPNSTYYPYIKGRKYDTLRLDFLGDFYKNLNSTLRYINISPIIAKIKEMTNPVKIGELPKGEPIYWKMEDVAPNLRNGLIRWSNYVAGVRDPREWFHITGGAGSIVQALTRNLAFHVLGFGVRSAFIQPSALVGVTPFIGPKYLIKGVSKYFSKAEREMALKESDVLLSRNYETVIREIDESYERTHNAIINKAIDVQERLGEFSLKALQFGDMATAVSTWLGSFYKAMEVDKKTREEAKRYADDIVIRTQGSALRGHVSPIQRTVGGKALTAFQTFTINQFGLMLHDILGFKNPNVSREEAIKRTLSLIIGASIVSVIYEDMLGFTSPLPSPIRNTIEALSNDKSIPQSFYEGLSELIEVVPLIGGTLKYGSTPLGAVVEEVSDISARLGMRKGPVRGAVDLSARLIGFPGGGQIAKTAKQIREGGNPYETVMGTYPKHRRLLVEILAGEL